MRQNALGAVGYEVMPLINGFIRLPVAYTK